MSQPQSCTDTLMMDETPTSYASKHTLDHADTFDDAKRIRTEVDGMAATAEHTFQVDPKLSCAGSAGVSKDASSLKRNKSKIERSANRPKHPAYDEGTEVVCDQIMELSQELGELITDTSGDTNSIRSIQKKIANESPLPVLQKLLIGLAGNTGEGKSMLINALTNHSDLAKALDSGKACTKVPIVYCAAETSQKQKCTARVRFLDPDCIEGMLVTAVQDWVAYANPEVEDEYSFEDDDDDSHRYELRRPFKEKAEAAVSLFYSVFRTRLQFSTLQVAQNSLDLLSRGKTNERLAELLSDVNDRLNVAASMDADGSLGVDIQRERLAEIWDEIDFLFGDDTVPGPPAIWPFVKQVRFSVQGSSLLEAVTLVDLPGSSDSDVTRVAATNRFIAGCDYLLVIARAGRIAHNATVDELLARYSKVFEGRVAVVSTKCDENIEAEIVNELGRSLVDRQGFDERSHQIEALKGVLEDLDADLTRLEEEEAASGSDGDNERGNDAQVRYAEVEQRMKTKQDELDRLEHKNWLSIYEARNNSNRDQLINQRTQHLPPGTSLNVFATSSKYYLDLNERRKRGNVPRLTASQTGIPDLQAYLYGLAAPAIFDNVESHISGSLTVLLRGTEIWATKKALDDDIVPPDLTREPRGVLNEVRNGGNVIMKALSESVTRPLRRERGPCVTSALDFVEKSIAGTRFCSLKAAVRRNGRYFHDWNVGLTEVFVEVLDQGWAKFESKTRKNKEKINDKIAVAFTGVTTLLRNDPISIFIATQVFSDIVKARSVRVRQAVKREQDKFHKDLRQIHLDARVGGDDHYFLHAMKPQYRRSEQDSGTGWTRRFIQALRTFLSLPGAASPFATVEREIAVNTRAAFRQYEQRVAKHLQAELAGIDAEFGSMLNDDPDTPEDLELRKRVLAFLPRAEKVRCDMITKLEEIRARYSVVGGVEITPQVV